MLTQSRATVENYDSSTDFFPDMTRKRMPLFKRLLIALTISSGALVATGSIALAAEGDFDANGFTAGDRVNCIHGEFDFLEDIQHFAAHITRGPDDGDAIAHLCLSFTERTVPLRPARPGRKARAFAALRKLHGHPT